MAVQNLTSTGQLRGLQNAGSGFVINTHWPTAPGQHDRPATLHEIACRTLLEAEADYKLFAEALDDAKRWLDANKGREGSGWKVCRICRASQLSRHAVDRSNAEESIREAVLKLDVGLRESRNHLVAHRGHHQAYGVSWTDDGELRLHFVGPGKLGDALGKLRRANAELVDRMPTTDEITWPAYWSLRDALQAHAPELTWSARKALRDAKGMAGDDSISLQVLVSDLLDLLALLEPKGSD